MAKEYRSRVDAWIAAVLPLPFVGAAGAIAAGWATGDRLTLWIGVGSLAFLVALYAGLVLPMRYTVADDGLHVRAGRMRLHVTWDRLVAVSPSSNPLSSPALSLRRLLVEYRTPKGRERSVLISPTDRDAFLRDLAAASPRHELVGGRLVART